MVLKKKLSCLWTLGLCLVASKSSAKVPSITDQNFKDSCVEAHNVMRGKVWPPAADMKHMVVWANSYKVGCAIKMCPNLGRHQTVIFVCNYGPAGNYPNRPPYTEGDSCSLCSEKDTCIEKLCRNKELDKPAKYPNWSPQGKAPQLISYHSWCLVSVLLRLF
ncbi:GLIPR1-like protein 1 isoform X2 [Suricata suricatta]|uniref:GLIPR1-like protein 1 isoform X2 n=1 Tax=Suricata suricatta TaxID=37032 RepID=UPI001155F406|nr:GLIPR1-like protein 1 isoform X2 [Suricata suricatta]